MYLLLWVAVSLLCSLSATQDCSIQGQRCEDDKDCCGGCCIKDTCTESDVSCAQDDEDACLSHECPPGFECYLYQPSDCPGCDEVPDCRIFHDPN